MNLSELARRLRVNPEELREKLPQLGISVGKHAIKIDNRVASQIMEAWGEMKRRERVTARMQEQKDREARRAQRAGATDAAPIALPAYLTVREFATRLQLPVPKVMQELMQNGILASLNERIDYDTAAVIAEDLGFKPQKEEVNAAAPQELAAVDRVREVIEERKGGEMKPRPPVVVVMGHVDHGKTKLLDAIRHTNVIDTEEGGITQHIGAYQVIRKDHPLTFIDTPGHEAFTMMRSRGAKVADLAILVVAADGGVQPQTKEAVNIIKSAALPFIVALNKMDSPHANADRVKGELAELGLTPEDWGGKTIVVPISAKKGEGIDALLDMLLLVADMEKERLQSDPTARAIGTVIESHVSPGEGPAATVLVQSGTLRAGDTLGVNGYQYGRVRAMKNWQGEDAREAPPSMPVKILGWKIAPAIGDIMEIPKDAGSLQKLKATDSSVKATEEVASIRPSMEETGEENSVPKKMVNLVIRADVLGSLEAILGMLDTIKHKEVGVKVVGKGLGNLTDTDVLNGEGSGAILFGFNVRAGAGVQELARDRGVDMRFYGIIYKLFDDVLAELQKLLPSETIVTEAGRATILAHFKKTKDGHVIGCKVNEGQVSVGMKVRLARAGTYIGEGEVVSVQSGQATVKAAKMGQECGVEMKTKAKPEIGDTLELYREEKQNRLLEIKGIRKR